MENLADLPKDWRGTVVTRDGTEDESDATPTLLERLDLALAARLAQRAELVDFRAPDAWSESALGPGVEAPAVWVARALGLRGIAMTGDDAAAILGGETGRYRPDDQEARLVVGLRRALRRVEEQALQGRLPDGWFLVELFRMLVGELPRFRDNTLRVDLPWDSVLYVPYPPAGEVRALLDTFDAAHAFRDFPSLFESLHPVRQSFRILWRFARIAPFPDFNLLMGLVAMNAWLLARGYPIISPDRGDRSMLGRLLAGPPPKRIVRFEARLLAAVETSEV
jgi:hypothetical protein